VTDLGCVDPSLTTVAFEVAIEVERGPTTRPLARDGQGKRATDGHLAGASRAAGLNGTVALVNYTVSNLPPAGFTWFVAAPIGPWLLWQGWKTSPRPLPS